MCHGYLSDGKAEFSGYTPALNKSINQCGQYIFPPLNINKK